MPKYRIQYGGSTWEVASDRDLDETQLSQLTDQVRAGKFGVPKNQAAVRDARSYNATPEKPKPKTVTLPSFLQPTDTLKRDTAVPGKPKTLSETLKADQARRDAGNAQIEQDRAARLTKARELYVQGNWKAAKQLDPEGFYPIPENQQEREFATEGGKILPGRGIEYEGINATTKKIFKPVQNTVAAVLKRAPLVNPLGNLVSEEIRGKAGEMAADMLIPGDAHEFLEELALNAGLGVAGKVLTLARKSKKAAVSLIKTLDLTDVSKSKLTEAVNKGLLDELTIEDVQGSIAGVAGKRRAAQGGAQSEATLTIPETPTPTLKGTAADPKVQYHGTSKPVGELGSVFDRDQSGNIYGPGFYTTDSLEVAGKYTKKGGGKAPVVYKVEWTGEKPPRLLDLDEPIPDDLLPFFSGEIWGDIPKGTKGTDAYSLIREALAEDGSWPTYEVDDLFHGISYNLQKRGYDGVKHKGGQLVGKVDHNVEVYFGDPVDGKVPIRIGEATPGKPTLKGTAADVRVNVPPAKPPTVKPTATPEPKPPIIVDQANSTKLLQDMGRGIPDKDATTVQAMMDEAVKTYNGDAVQNVARNATKGGKSLNETETLQVGLRIKELSNLRDEVLKSGDVSTLGAIEDQLAELAEAGIKSGTAWAREGIARQVEIARAKGNTAAHVKARAKIAVEEAGGTIGTKEQASLNMMANRIEVLANTLDTIKKQIQDNWSVKPVGGKRYTRDQALGTLRKLGVPTAEAGKKAGTGAGKQSGAITLPDSFFKDNRVRKAVRDLLKTYHDDGVKTLNDAVDRMHNDLPGLTDDDLYGLISDEFRLKKVESNVAQLEAQRFIRTMQAKAVARTKPLYVRAGKAVLEEMKTFQRAFQTSFDLGFATIQGAKSLISNPVTTVRSVGESLKMIPKVNTQKAFDQHLAALQARPMYARAKKAGIQFADLGGGAESTEFFGGGLSRKLPGIFKSEAMFNSYRNELRMSLFEAFAKNAADDADQMKSIADLVNVMTGTGMGKPGDVAKKLGNIFYAPNYEVSKWQFAMGRPLTDAIGKHGIKSVAAQEAAKVYMKNAAVLVGGVYAAKKMGADINTDPRSADFGKLTLPGGMQIDLFGKAYSPIRNAAQLIWGGESRKGNFTPANDFGAIETTVGRYVQGKMAPASKTVLAGLTKGTVYDFDKEEEVPISAGQLLKDSAPIGLKSIYSNWDKVPAHLRPLLLIEVMGVNTGQVKPKTGTPAPKMGLPPGLAKMLGPD